MRNDLSDRDEDNKFIDITCVRCTALGPGRFQDKYGLVPALTGLSLYLGSQHSAVCNIWAYVELFCGRVLSQDLLYLF